MVPSAWRGASSAPVPGGVHHQQVGAVGGDCGEGEDAAAVVRALQLIGSGTDRGQALGAGRGGVIDPRGDSRRGVRFGFRSVLLRAQ